LKNIFFKKLKIIKKLAFFGKNFCLNIGVKKKQFVLSKNRKILDVF